VNKQYLELLNSGLESIYSQFDPVQYQKRSEDILSKFSRYVNELELWNPKLGLLEAEGHEIITKHFLDCAAAVPLFLNFCEPGEHVADLGTGAGFPGIILAILDPELYIHLVEKMKRRVDFLRNQKLILGLNNVSIHSIASENLELQFDLITSRAYSPIHEGQWNLIMKRLKPGGVAILYKGKLESIRKELTWKKDLHLEPLPTEVLKLGKNTDLIHSTAYYWSYSVPGLEAERNLLLFLKPIGKL
jgi:16S rRNA (guanine527-N7)-methyltransferase